MQQAGHGGAYTRCIALEMIPAFFDDPDAPLKDCLADEKPITFMIPPPPG